MTDRYISHVTLTTGHTRRSYRSEVGDDVVDMLATTLLPEALARADDDIGPQILDTGLYLQADAGGRCGLIGAVVQPVAGAAQPWVTVAVLGVAAEARCAGKIWDLLHMTGTYYVTDASRPPAPPWCAARLTEHAEAIGPQRLMMLGDFERCLAWAWLENGGP